MEKNNYRISTARIGRSKTTHKAIVLSSGSVVTYCNLYISADSKSEISKVTLLDDGVSSCKRCNYRSKRKYDIRVRSAFDVGQKVFLKDEGEGTIKERNICHFEGGRSISYLIAFEKCSKVMDECDIVCGIGEK